MVATDVHFHLTIENISSRPVTGSRSPTRPSPTAPVPSPTSGIGRDVTIDCEGQRHRRRRRRRAHPRADGDLQRGAGRSTDEVARDRDRRRTGRHHPADNTTRPRSLASRDVDLHLTLGACRRVTLTGIVIVDLKAPFAPTTDLAAGMGSIGFTHRTMLADGCCVEDTAGGPAVTHHVETRLGRRDRAQLRQQADQHLGHPGDVTLNVRRDPQDQMGPVCCPVAPFTSAHRRRRPDQWRLTCNQHER